MVVLQHSIYRLLLMVLLTIWARAETEDLTCAQKGGTCVPEDDNSCSHEADYSGCDEDEMCCISFAGSLRLKRQTQNCGKPKRCQIANYKGICKPECPDDRIPVGPCQNQCTCCGCKIKPQCKNKHGYCIRKGIDTCDGKTKDLRCRGNKCTCCIPTCPPTDACLDADGRCDESCNDDEEPNNNIECINNNCVCCVPKKCANSTCCVAAGGYCNNTCPLGKEEDKTLCEGIDCTCCLPTPPPPADECPCDNNFNCRSASGHCAHRCQAGERPDTSLPCQGKSCVCCVPDCPCRDNSKCKSVNGRCDQICNDHEVVNTDIPCTGDSCVCCVPKNNCSCTDECKNAEGHCDTCCGRNEMRNDSIPCHGDNCSCCVPRPPCQISDRCAALDGRRDESCNSDEIWDRSIPCEGDNCVCCIPKMQCEDIQTCGHHPPLIGLCKGRCHSNEIIIGNDSNICSNPDCMCCVPETVPGPCIINSDECKAAGGFCDDECYDDETMSPTISCGPEGCGCCIRKEFSCLNTHQCAASHGNCKASCDEDEIPDTSIPCNDGHCVCCVPRSNCSTSSVSIVDPLCIPTQVCVFGYGGRCDTCCKDDEIRNITIPCDNNGDANCACCVPKEPCKDTCECEAVNGRCDTMCQSNETPNYNVQCEGQNCVCCVPESDCSPKDGCKKPGDHCSLEECPDGFTTDFDGCTSDPTDPRCRCCKKESDCSPKDGCKKPGDHCSLEACPDGFTTDFGGCTSDPTDPRCRCCKKDCLLSHSCSLLHGGRCDKTCHSHLDEIASSGYGCDEESGCHCCHKPDEVSCNFGTTDCHEANGICKDECTSNEKPTSHNLCVYPHCFCCVPDCPPSPSCSAIKGGYCAKICKQGETVSIYTTCEGSDCHCCIQKLIEKEEVVPVDIEKPGG